MKNIIKKAIKMIEVAGFVGLIGLAIAMQMQIVELKNTVETQEQEIKVIASQKAPDGEQQKSLSDGTDITITPEKEIIVDKQPEVEEVVEVIEKIEKPEQKNELVPNVEEVEVAPEVETTKIIELADGSSIVYNIDTNLYTFYPAIMGDWFYEFDNAQHLQWAIETYQEISPQIGKINDIQIQNKWMQEDGDIVVDLSDGSWLVYNIEKNKFAFQPVHMGDWDMEFNTIEEMRNAITTYYDIVTNWEE